MTSLRRQLSRLSEAELLDLGITSR
ncbi:MAG: DUF1127 domain-containing protein [Chloroflexi bacterium]|nr:DUF1127 domain-containing protein [Chloroflexota bacterium]